MYYYCNNNSTCKNVVLFDYKEVPQVFITSPIIALVLDTYAYKCVSFISKRLETEIKVKQGGTNAPERFESFTT